MNKKGFTLIELLAVIVILAIIALITTPIVLNLINQSKEAANKRSVEAYAKAVEYAVIDYEYNHNGELPTDFDVIKNNVDYSNSDVKCNVAINCDLKGSVELTGCQVGSYTNNYYKYSSLKSNKGADVDSSNSAPSGNASVKVACSSGGSSSNPYETDFSGDYVYESIGYTKSGNNGNWYTELHSDWDVYIRKSASSDDKEVCKVYSSGTVCIQANHWDCDEQSNGHCVNSAGYVEGKRIELEAKGASCQLSSYYLYCFDNNFSDNDNICYIRRNGYVYCYDGGYSCYLDYSGANHCEQ